MHRDQNAAKSRKPMPPQNLDPRVKALADRIYCRNPRRYRPLIVWIREAIKHHYRNEVIAGALKEADRYIDGVREWWSYLNKVVDKVEKNMNAGEHDRLHEQRKQELKEAAAKFYAQTSSQDQRRQG